MLHDRKRDAGFAGTGRAQRSSAKGSMHDSSPAANDQDDESESIETLADLTDTENERVFEDIITEEIIGGDAGDGGIVLLTSLDPEAPSGAKQQGENERPSERPIPVPLPGTLFLFALGLGGLQVTSRRKK